MTCIDVAALRGREPRIVCLGSYRGIVQSILDFDYLCGRAAPSVVAIVATGRRMERYFFGHGEVNIPVYGEVSALPARVREGANLLLNLSSGRRVLSSTRQALGQLPGVVGEVVFAEGLPERHALVMAREAAEAGVWVVGAASVGLVLPGRVKLGAIGGVEASQLVKSRLMTPGRVAVISSSGGMVNEVIRTVASSGQALSFGLAIGGDRFPMMTPVEAFRAAQDDPETQAIVYFGELGGRDEYELADLMKAGGLTKPVVAYIAGTVAELFETPPQFGHAKAIAPTVAETARAKAEALREAGAQVGGTYSEFVGLVRALPGAAVGVGGAGIGVGALVGAMPPVGVGAAGSGAGAAGREVDVLVGRRRGLIAASVSGDTGEGFQILGENLLDFARDNSFAKAAMSMFLGRKTSSVELERFVDFVLRLLVDHGPYVSGAVNTIVAARAGRDLVSSLAAGLLTIGPRFGGAINQSAATWLYGVRAGLAPAQLVEELASRGEYIAGIGHRKYRSDLPDPRVEELLAHADRLERKRFVTFALGVEAETVRKKGNLILNVDGTIAAVMLDLLSEKEGYSDEELQGLVATEFFNALFVMSRTVGFMAHYFDQLRMDEGIFRLEPGQVAHIQREDS